MRAIIGSKTKYRQGLRHIFINCSFPQPVRQIKKSLQPGENFTCPNKIDNFIDVPLEVVNLVDLSTQVKNDTSK